MVEIESGENPDAEGYLLHELQNVTVNEPEDDIEAEQRERMPQAAFLRENYEEIEIEENNLGKIDVENKEIHQKILKYSFFTFQ